MRIILSIALLIGVCMMGCQHHHDHYIQSPAQPPVVIASPQQQQPIIVNPSTRPNIDIHIDPHHHHHPHHPHHR